MLRLWNQYVVVGGLHKRVHVPFPHILRFASAHYGTTPTNPGDSFSLDVSRYEMSVQRIDNADKVYKGVDNCSAGSSGTDEHRNLELLACKKTTAQQIIEALKTYRAVHNIPAGSPVAIPDRFVVPHDSSDWPQELWGMKLGRAATYILHRGAYRKYKGAFSALGLSSKHELTARQVVDAIKTYKTVHNIAAGSPVVIPVLFIVPQGSSEWPQELWGMRLGQITLGILRAGTFRKYKQVFSALGLAGYRDESARQAIEAIKTYRAVHNIPEGSPVVIPQAYVVPHGTAEWPQELWGMKLGWTACKILQKGIFSKFANEFSALGLSAHHEFAAEQVIAAVRAYRAVHNIPEGSPVVIPQAYVVPHGTAEWPQELWGLKLGRTACEILQKGIFSKFANEFSALGLSAHNEFAAEQLIAAVRAYRAVHNIPEGSPVVIPTRFVVPHDSSDWPQELWGKRLGGAVMQYHAGRCYQECRDEFKKLGLAQKYGSLKERARKFLLAIETYRKVFKIAEGSQVFVRKSFVVPHGSPDWPQELWDMKLGIKVSGYVNRNTYPEYTEQFRALGLYRKWE
jgi:hypothetical protein